MSRRWAITAAFLLVLSACGDDASNILLTGTTGTTAADTTISPTTTAAEGGFPPATVQAYLDGCADGPDDMAFCLCTIDEFQDRLTLEEFLALDQELNGAVVNEVTVLCLRQTASQGSTTSTTQAPGTTAATLDMGRLTDLTILDLEEYWGIALQATYGIAYENVAAAIPYFPSQGNLPQCGPEQLPRDVYEQNAFYCRIGDFVAWDAEDLMPGLYSEFGDFAVALVLAHEWGHVVQARAGVSDFLATIVTELQADCFAGAWAAHVDGGNSALLTLQPGDLDEAMAGYLLFGDPPITSPNDPAAHGSAFDRVNAFQDGFFNDLEACRQYPDGRAVAVDIPFTQEDLETGGDLPYAETAPSLIATLESFWEAAFPNIFGGSWVPVSDYGPYAPSTGVLPPCGDAEVDPGAYENNAFYCPEGDYVAWDDESLFPFLYQEVGDFAIGMILGHEWATAAQARAGLAIEGVEAELQADCLTGVWTAAMVTGIPIVLADGTDTSIYLSAEDLDEGVTGFILFGDDPATGAPIGGTAFERFDSFQDGFFGGSEQCVTP